VNGYRRKSLSSQLDRVCTLHIITAMNRLAAVAIVGVLLLPCGGRDEAAPRDCPEDATPSLFAVSGTPVLCMSEKGRCLKIGSTKAADRVVSHPAPANTRLREDHGHMQVCAGSQCRDLGPAVTSAARESLARNLEPEIAPDLSAVVTYGKTPDDVKGEPQFPVPQVFSIPGDRELILKPPASYGREGATPWLDNVQLLGGTLVATWMSCAADGCVRSIVVGPDGANLGNELRRSVSVVLDDHRIALAGNGGDVVVLDRGTARVIAQATFDSAGRDLDALEVRGIVALSADEVAILWEKQDLRAVRVKIGKHMKLGPRRKLPRCS
jgi:hypothetical protein